jgi:hypothetical protein
MARHSSRTPGRWGCCGAELLIVESDGGAKGFVPAPFTLRRLWMCEAELRCPFYQDRNVVPDTTVVKQLVFFGHDLLYGGSWPIGETFGQTIYDCHECPGFGFFGHPQSFGQTRRRVNGKQAGTSDGFSSTVNRSNRYWDPASCGRFYTLLSLDNAFSMACRTGPVRPYQTR